MEAHRPDGEIPGHPPQAGDLRWGFVGARFGLGLAEPSALDAKTAALLQLAGVGGHREQVTKPLTSVAETAPAAPAAPAAA